MIQNKCAHNIKQLLNLCRFEDSSFAYSPTASYALASAIEFHEKTVYL